MQVRRGEELGRSDTLGLPVQPARHSQFDPEVGYSQ